MLQVLHAFPLLLKKIFVFPTSIQAFFLLVFSCDRVLLVLTLCHLLEALASGFHPHDSIETSVLKLTSTALCLIKCSSPSLRHVTLWNMFHKLLIALISVM